MNRVVLYVILAVMGLAILVGTAAWLYLWGVLTDKPPNSPFLSFGIDLYVLIYPCLLLLVGAGVVLVFLWKMGVLT